MKPVHAQFSFEDKKPLWPALALAVAIILAVVALVVTLSGCDQPPIPVNPTAGHPCGQGAYFECPSGVCCYAATEYCGQKGHACDENSCCYSGSSGGTWAASRGDGGAASFHKGLSPQQVHDVEQLQSGGGK